MRTDHEKEIKIGNCMPLRDIPVGVNIHNVELQPGGGGKIARSAGTSVTISGLDGNYSLIKMTSGEVRKIDSRCHSQQLVSCQIQIKKILK